MFREDRIAVEKGAFKISRHDAADAAKVRRRGEVGTKDMIHILAGAQIRCAENAGAEARRAVNSGPTHRGDTVHEIGFADTPHRLRTIRTVERIALREYGLYDVVTRLRDVVGDLIAQIDLLLETQKWFRGRSTQVPQM